MAILEVAGLTKRFGGIAALDGVDLVIERPAIYGLIGPNGAGKTSLFDAVTGRLALDNGTIRFAGHDITGWPSHRIVAAGVNRTFQECRIFPEKTCLENVLFAAQDKGLRGVVRRMVTFDRRAERERLDDARRLLSLVNLEGYAQAPAAMLSFGQKRLLEIASALITRPRIILFDEPASGVNPALLDTLREFIARMFDETRIAFLIVEHNMEFIMDLSEHIIVMHQGAVLEQGPPAAIQESAQVIEAYLG